MNDPVSSDAQDVACYGAGAVGSQSPESRKFHLGWMDLYYKWVVATNE